MLSSSTSIDPEVGHDWLYVQLSVSSALAGLARNARVATGMKIIHHELLRILYFIIVGKAVP